MEKDDYIGPPVNFGVCEMKSLSATATCYAWETPKQTFTIMFRKSGEWVYILLPELIYKSTTKPTASDITISIPFESEEEKQKWVGETSSFGVFGFVGREKKSDLENTVDFVPMTGVLNENGSIYIGGQGFPLFRNSLDGSPVGTVSTLLTLIPKTINEEDGEEEIPFKLPKI